MNRHVVRAVLFVLLSLSLLAGLAGASLAQDATPTDEVTILAADEEVAGVSLAEWDARWWQWAVSLPEEVNPALDETGEACSYGQHGPVFFLPANFLAEPVTFSCVVPAGTAVFFPVAGWECSTVESPPSFGRDEAELRACAAAATDSYTEVSASVNGQPVSDIEQYRVSSPLFTLIFPENNVFGAPPGIAAAVSDDYALLLEPLPEGEHEIQTLGVLELEGETVAFETTYQITVAPPQVVEPEATPDTGTPAATPAT